MSNEQSQAVTLTQLLAAREWRAQRQHALLQQMNQVLIIATVVMPGAVKQNALTQRLIHQAYDSLMQLCQCQGWTVCHHEQHENAAGSVLFLCVEASALQIKSLTVVLEAEHPWGRLWDIDVIDIDATRLSRTALGFPARRCLLCDDGAHVCARMRRHSTASLLTQIEKIMHATIPL